MKASLLAICLWFACSLTPAISADGACEPISIFAAASTTNVIEQIAADYERETACSVSTIFAGSGTLARQIEAGAPADLFLSANKEWMDWIDRAGLVRPGNKLALLTNQLVFIVPADNADARMDVHTSPSILNVIGTGKLAIGDPATVPAGRYAQAALRHFGLSRLEEDQIVRASSVRAALTWVARGEANAGIVYRTDARIDDQVRIAGTIPSIESVDITYPLALIGRTPNSAARAFFTYLQSYHAARVFAEHGFSRAATQ